MWQLLALAWLCGAFDNKNPEPEKRGSGCGSFLGLIFAIGLVIIVIRVLVNAHYQCMNTSIGAGGRGY